MYSQLHGIVHQVCTGELSYPCLLFEWPKENLCNQAFTARSSLRHRGFEGVGFGCRLPTSVRKSTAYVNSVTQIEAIREDLRLEFRPRMLN